MACGLFSSMQANAVTETASFGVSATILANCALVAYDMDFGVVQLKDGAQASTYITTDCPVGTSGYVRVGSGLHLLDDSQRRLAQNIGSDTYYINYSLYIDSERTQELLVNSSSGFGGFPISGVGEPIPSDIFGYIPPQNGQPGGLYTDTVQVTLDY